MIFAKFRQTTSLSNLDNNVKGQMATIMILVIVAVLILILALSNLGQVSQQTTNVANAADTSALLLGSQLASKAHEIAVALFNECDSHTKCCVRGGLLAVILAIILIVIAIIIIVVTWGAGTLVSHALIVMAVCMLAGFIGGVIGGRIIQGEWNAAAFQAGLQGAMIGAMIGAAVCSIASAAYGVSAGATTPATGTANAVDGASGAQASSVLQFAPGEFVPEGTSVVTGTVTPAAGGASLGAGSTVGAGGGFAGAGGAQIAPSLTVFAPGATVPGGTMLATGCVSIGAHLTATAVQMFAGCRKRHPGPGGFGIQRDCQVGGNVHQSP